MYLNTIKPAEGSKKAPKRLGRGIGSGLGKTSGKGHKGQKARAGGYHKVGFEGGQMPLQRRLPKRGFNSINRADTARIGLDALNKATADVITIEVLKELKLIPKEAKKVKIYLHGELNKAITLKGISLSAGAKEALAKVGGIILED